MRHPASSFKLRIVGGSRSSFGFNGGRGFAKVEQNSGHRRHGNAADNCGEGNTLGGANEQLAVWIVFGERRSEASVGNTCVESECVGSVYASHYTIV